MCGTRSVSARRGAGRKPDAFNRDMADLLDQTVTREEWLNIVRMLVGRATRGNVRAAQLLIRFHYGSRHKPAPDKQSASAPADADPAGQTGA